MPTYPIGQNATTARDGEVNVANVVKGHVNGSNVSDEAIIVPSGAVDLPTTADATNPASGSTRLVARAGGLYVRTSGGAESGPLGGAVAPLAHAASHQDGGSDELALDGSQITSGTVAAARLGSGTASAGTVLHGDGVGGAAWTTAPARAVPLVANGEYCAPVLWAATSNHGLTAVGRMALSPVVLPAGTATRLTVSITANAASTWRLGLYPAGASGLPDGLSPVVDGGTAPAPPTTPTASPSRSQTCRSNHRRRRTGSIEERLRQRLDANRDHLALASPTAAQQRAQVARLTRQTNALIRQVLGLLDTDDTGD